MCVMPPDTAINVVSQTVGNAGGPTGPVNEQVGPSTGASNAQSRRTAKVWSELPAAEDGALAALMNPNCSRLFGLGTSADGTVSPAAVLQGLIQGPSSNFGKILVGPVDSEAGTTASAQTQGAVVFDGTNRYNEAEITINDTAGVFVNGSLQDQTVLILHELGHAMNDIFNFQNSIWDDGPKSGPGYVQRSEDNTALIKKNCL